LDDFRSTDEAIVTCLERARIAAKTDLPVLILGESGTGKTSLARAIHNSSQRAAGPFQSFSAATLSESLLDSQLFGHEKGAFTGATHRIRGKFELAHNGTLFIDEIIDLSLSAQASISHSNSPQEADLRLKTAEKRHIQAVMEKMGGNKSRTAGALGISRSTLDRKLATHQW
jgi:transcriptional regulator with PAS, ATPase and Fis domain